MPFININVIRRPSTPFLILLDQLMIVSCDDIITLNATVQKPGSYLWEQLSGTTVIWLSPTDELSAIFQQTLIRDDKVFRFWVNKNTPSEAYSDVLVTAVPREYIPALNPTVGAYIQPYADTEVARAVMVPGTSAEGAVSLNNPLRGITFADLTGSGIVGYKVYDVTGGVTETQIGAFNPPARSFMDVPGLASYRVDAIVNANDILHTARGIPAGFFPPADWLDMDTWDRGSVHLTSASDVNGSTLSTTITINRYEIVSQTTDYDEALVSLLDTRLDNTYTRYPLSLEVLPTEETEIYAHLLSGPFADTITRANLGIGGIG